MFQAHYVALAAAATMASAKISVQVHRNLEVANNTDVVVKFHCGEALNTHRRRLKAGASRTETIESIVGALKEHSTASQALVHTLLSSRPESATALKVASTWIDCSMYINDAPADLVQKISALSEVQSIATPAKFKAEQVAPVARANATEAATANQWGVDMIQAPALWAMGIKGDGVVVANIDTGVRYTHEALKSNWRSEYGWLDPYDKTELPNDPRGHGTHVMGTMVGTTQGMGVAPNAKWFACKGCTDWCYQYELMQCAQFIMCPHDKDGKNPDCSKAPHMINNSWGAYRGVQSWMDDALKAWRAANIIPVFCNGNDGSKGCGYTWYPASSPLVIGAGAVDKYDSLAYFSSFGPSVDNKLKPDISAPGDWVMSASNTDDTGLVGMSGTSMASPHIAGAVALYLSANKGATYDQVYTALTNTVDTDKLSPPDKGCGGIPNTEYPNHLFGYGRVNILKAITSPPSTPRPTRPLPPQKCGLWNDEFDIPGGDIKSVTQRTADDCCDECAKTPNCNSFTFMYDWDNTINGGVCWLKNSIDSNNLVYKKGAKSARMINAPTPPSKCGALEDNTDYTGNDLTSTKQTQAEACCADCEKTAGCKLFVWSSYNGGTCWLKSAKGPKKVANGAKAGQLPVSDKCSPIEENVDYFGNDIKSTAQASADACCGDCEKTAGCKLFVWSSQNGGTCWLKHTQGAKSTVAGAKAGKLLASPSCGAPETNVDFTGQDVAEAPGAQAADCCSACQANQACNAYSWLGGVCYLKGRRAGTTAKAGVVSARVDKCSALEVDVDYVGNDLSNVSADVADCCAICRQTSGCRAFSWANGVCYLKSGKGATRANTGVKSATVN